MVRRAVSRCRIARTVGRIIQGPVVEVAVSRDVCWRPSILMHIRFLEDATPLAGITYKTSAAMNLCSRVRHILRKGLIQQQDNYIK